jgi:hypothetical protein
MSAAISTSPQTLQNLNQLSLHKLTRENYPTWCTIIVPYLEGHNLFGNVTGDIPCPPRRIASSGSSSSTSDAMVENPAYSTWYQQDKLIMCTLISSLSENLLTHVVNLKTSCEVWVSLEKIFASESKARVMQYRYQLATLKKGAMSISDYFQKAQIMAQTLVAINEPLKDSKLVSYILAGLSQEYESEYKALANATVDILWIQSSLKELEIFLQSAPILFCDNIGATYLTSNPVFHARTKHVAIDYHFVRDLVAQTSLTVKFLLSKDQLVDVFTKPLVSTRFAYLRNNLTVCSQSSGLRGTIRLTLSDTSHPSITEDKKQDQINDSMR